MNYQIYSHRYGIDIVQIDPIFTVEYNEIIEAIESISDNDLINQYNIGRERREGTKSLSDAINILLKQRLEASDWISETAIFREPPYSNENRGRWRLDFAKELISVEVAFNHQEATAHNLMKPVLASELNHVQKAIQTRIGVIITATNSLKRNGNFDSAIGTFESFINYFKPYNVLITTPIILIGLEAPATFFIDRRTRTAEMRLL